MLLRRRSASDFRAEIESHIQLEADRLREQGLSEEEARAAARRAFGNATRAEERFYESRRSLFWDHVWQDLRLAPRLLRRSPGFSSIAILTIALGVGATTAIFSVVDATLLHPLSYPHPEQLVRLEDDLAGVGSRDVGMSTPEWQDLERSGVFTSISPTVHADANLTGSDQPERAPFLLVASNYFALLGVKPQLGRTFDPDDATRGFVLDVVISDGLWRRAFAADPGILGKHIRLDNDTYRVIGVMPAGFLDPGRSSDERSVDIWVAAGFAAVPFADPPRRNVRLLSAAIARLAPGETVETAQSRLNAFVASERARFPVDYPRQAAWALRAVPLRDSIVGDVRQSLLLLMGAVGLVLVIGCVNVANLLLARASARAPEMAIRRAIGAARGRLTQQLVTESVFLSLLGGMAGVAILLCLKRLLLHIVPDGLPRASEISLSWTVLCFALGISVIVGALFGLAPVLYTGRLEGRGSKGSREQTRVRHTLVATEFALSLILMTSAGLLMRSFWDLLDVRLGFQPHGVMAVRVKLPVPNDRSTDIYRTAPQQATFVREVMRRVMTLPGVQETAIGDVGAIPLGHSRNDLDLVSPIFEGRGLPRDRSPVVDGPIVSPDYFHLLGFRLIRGRYFSESDDENAPGVAVINDAFARTYWPNEDPIGKRVELGSTDSAWTTVVGVVADARTESPAHAGVPTIYSSAYQRVSKNLAIFLRGQLNAAAIPIAVRKEVQSVNPGLPVFQAQTLTDALGASLSERRFSLEMVSAFAVTALLLAALGIYGVVSYIVSERTREIGIRLALGAQRSSILAMVLRQGLELAGAGAALGLVGAFLVSRLMAGVLFGVRPTDPVTFVSVTIAMTVVALAACYVPAWRAMRVDPTVAQRS